MKQILIIFLVLSTVCVPNEVECLALRKFGITFGHTKQYSQTLTREYELTAKINDYMGQLVLEKQKQLEEQRRKIIQSHLGTNIGHKSVMNDFYSRF